jgi:hypothetical protein
MTAESTATPQPKKGNCFLWGCLIVLVLTCLVFGCLGTTIALPLFTDFDPFGLKDMFDEFIPWEEYMDDSSSFPDLPELFSDESDSTLEEEESSFVSPDSSALDHGHYRLTPFLEIDFPISFSYPEGWESMEDDYADGMTFFDPNSYTYLSVGRDWLCNGCSSAADSSLKMWETLEFQAQEGTFTVVYDAPYSVSTGEDAHFNAYEWIDLDGNYHWAYDINIVVEEYNIYFFMQGDDPGYFDTYQELFEEIGASYHR